MERKRNGFDITPSELGGILVFCFKKREHSAVRELMHLVDDISKDTMKDKDSSDINNARISIVMDKIEDEVKKLKYGSDGSYYINKGMGEIPCIGCIVPNDKDKNIKDRFPEAMKPLQLCYTIWNETMLRNREKRDFVSIHTTLRSVQRILPLEKICYANVNDIKRMMEQLLFTNHSEIFKRDVPAVPILPQNQTSYAIFINSRYHDTIQKNEIIDIITFLLQSVHCIWPNGPQKPSMFYVDLKEPKISICVELFKNICGASIIVNYITLYKKGNIQLQCRDVKL